MSKKKYITKKIKRPFPFFEVDGKYYYQRPNEKAKPSLAPAGSEVLVTEEELPFLEKFRIIALNDKEVQKVNKKIGADSLLSISKENLDKIIQNKIDENLKPIKSSLKHLIKVEPISKPKLINEGSEKSQTTSKIID